MASTDRHRYNKALDEQIFRIDNDRFPNGLVFNTRRRRMCYTPPVFSPCVVCLNRLTGAGIMARMAGISDQLLPNLDFLQASRQIWDTLDTGETAIGCCPRQTTPILLVYSI